ncbi:PD-(D/E)XK nuclease family protein [Lactiplantibacillus fabifermentans]|nr:PD-(D/E)XK nuclease family protein [Lactiplantibacillus fabifermentans]
MTLQFVIGPAKFDHRSPMVAQLVAKQAQVAAGDEFFYLVPDHIKFDTEVDILKRLAQAKHQDKLSAQSQVQIFSFTRLAWYLMKNEPAYQVPRLSNAGINMLLFRIMREHASELQLFSGEISQTGFIGQLAREIKELQLANLAPEDVTQLAMNAQAGDLKAKLHDLAIVYADFVAATAETYLKPADVLAQLNRYLQQQDLHHMHIYFELSGSAQLDAQEQGILTTMLERGANVTISLILDREYQEQLPEQGTLFYQTGRLYFRLYQYAQIRKVAVLPTIKAENLRVTAGLAALDDFWRGQTLREKPEYNANIHYFQTDTRQTEVAQVARQIRQLIAASHGQLHYRDFLVLTRHLNNYETMLAPIMHGMDIPYFVDLKRSMADHPLVELISALFELGDKKYQYQDVMRVLKTELLLPTIEVAGKKVPMPAQDYRQAVDLTENFILKTGYSGNRWTQRTDWQYFQLNQGDAGVETEKSQAVSDQINLIHHFVGNVFPPFYRQLAAAQDGRQAAKILYNFLVGHGVDKQLMAWRDQALAEQRVEAAAEPEQTWQTFCDMLDEYVTILGNAPFEPDDFLALLQAGFEGASYSQIPSTLDQVLVSESEMVQTQNRKVVFLMGATDLVMPDRIMDNNLLSDVDKESLKPALDELDGEHYLSDSAVIQLGDERFLSYLSFLNAKQDLYLSVPLKDDQGGNVSWSNYVKQIASYFSPQPKDMPTVPASVYLSTPDATQGNFWPYVGTKRRTISHIIQAYREILTTNTDRNRVGEPIKPASVWVWLRRQLVNDAQFGDLAQQLLAGLSYRNVPVPLTQKSVDDLYHQDIYTSISKLEEFYRNRYAYFLKYGLKLRERDVFELSPASTGEFFHAVLDQLVKAVRDDQLALRDLNDAQLDKYLSVVTIAVLDQPQFEILSSSNRMSYVRQQLINTVRQIAFAIRNQSKLSAAKPTQTELLFGNVNHEAGLKALDFQVDANHAVHVRGKIDRLDQIQVADQAYLGIVDYKSSVNKFDFEQAYYGLAMQMLTYLDAVLANENDIMGEQSDKVKLAGALYMHIQNPTLKPKDLSAGFEDALLKANRYQGILLNDPELLSQLDSDARENYGSSKVYPFRHNKTGDVYKSSSLVTEDDLDALIAHNETLIVKAAEAIFAGALDINPVRFDDKTTALQYSPYLSIMQFDAMLPENNYHDLVSLSPKDVIDRISAEQGGPAHA